MGGSSSTTRRVTVINEDSSGVIRLSENVVRKLKGEAEQESPSPRSSSTTTIRPSTPERNLANLVGSSDSLTLRQEHESEIARLERSWRIQVRELETINKNLWKVGNEKFATNLTEVEKKYAKQKCDPVCQQQQQKIIDCYLANKNCPLNCAPLVREFRDCVADVRREVFNRKG